MEGRGTRSLLHSKHHGLEEDYEENWSTEFPAQEEENWSSNFRSTKCPVEEKEDWSTRRSTTTIKIEEVDDFEEADEVAHMVRTTTLLEGDAKAELQPKPAAVDSRISDKEDNSISSDDEEGFYSAVRDLETKLSLQHDLLTHTRGSCTVSYSAGQGPKSGRNFPADTTTLEITTLQRSQEQPPLDDEVQVSSSDITQTGWLAGRPETDAEVEVEVAHILADSTFAVQEGQISVLLDGGATCSILQSDACCINVRPCRVRIDTGTGSLICTQTGDFVGSTLINGP